MGKFEVGQKVYHVLWGLCEIVIIFGDVLRFRSLRGTEDGALRLDGKERSRDVNPILLTLDEARAKGYDVPKVVVKKTVRMYSNVYPDGPALPHFSKSDAVDAVSGGFIACVELVGEYEVEE
jgi:hypothetical protein